MTSLPCRSRGPRCESQLGRPPRSRGRRPVARRTTHPRAATTQRRSPRSPRPRTPGVRRLRVGSGGRLRQAIPSEVSSPVDPARWAARISARTAGSTVRSTVESPSTTGPIALPRGDVRRALLHLGGLHLGGVGGVGGLISSQVDGRVRGGVGGFRRGCGLPGRPASPPSVRWPESTPMGSSRSASSPDWGLSCSTAMSDPLSSPCGAATCSCVARTTGITSDFRTGRGSRRGADPCDGALDHRVSPSRSSASSAASQGSASADSA